MHMHTLTAHTHAHTHSSLSQMHTHIIYAHWSCNERSKNRVEVFKVTGALRREGPNGPIGEGPLTKLELLHQQHGPMSSWKQCAVFWHAVEHLQVEDWH